MATEPRVEWKWGALAALAMVLIALYPQMNLWSARGQQWQGSYVMTQGDEVMYSAYVNALVDGRPRRNDSFNGRDLVAGQGSYESLNSIQFVPAYLVAMPARAFGLNTATAFIWLLVLAAIASTLAIFWLVATLTGDSKSAAVGALLTLCFGAVVGSDCCWEPNAFTEMIPFLRRYHPSASFPLFFVFCVLIWRAVTCERARARLINSLVAATVFSVLVFSYFFMWTAAAAWFGCVVLLWLAFRRDQLRRLVLAMITVGAFAIAAIGAFALMFLKRNPAIDQGQLLVSTHAPDLFNQPQILGFMVLCGIAYGVLRKRIDLRSPLVLFVLSFSLLPFVLFNQQVLTGMSIQPIHYKVFIANYVALITTVLGLLVLWRGRIPQRRIPASVLLVAAVVAVSWVAVEVFRGTEHWAQKEKLRDDLFAAAQQMTSMAYEDGSLQPAFAGKTTFPTVFTFAVDETLEVSKSIPSYSPLAVLWSLHSDAYISAAESKDRYYRHLYYCGLTPSMVETRMRDNQFWVVVPLFSSERVLRGLVHDFKEITLDDIREERLRYEEFYQNFSREQAFSPTLNFVVVQNGPEPPNFENLDRWYERDSGKTIGAFTIHRVKPRSQTNADD